MARGGEPADLDVLDTAGEGGTGEGSEGDRSDPSRSRSGSRARRGRRAWPWVAAAVVVIGAVVAFPVRIRLAEAALARLDSRWEEAIGLAANRDSLVERLAAAGTPDDQIAHDATRRVDVELAGRLEPIRRAVAGEHSFDPGIRHLTAVEGRALSRAQAGLRTDRYAGLDPDHLVDRALAEQRDRLHRSVARSAASIHPLTSADRTLTSLAKWSDEPIGVVLAVPFNLNLELLDIDHSSVSVPRGTPAADQVLARAGYVVAFGGRAGGTVWSIATDGRVVGASHQLGVADNVFAGLRPDAVWLVTNRSLVGGTDLVRWVAVEMDGSGRQLARVEGPPAAPAGPVPQRAAPVAETTEGLLIFQSQGEGSPTLHTRRPDGSETPSFTVPSFRLEPGPTALAWIDDSTPDHTIWLRSTLDGSERPVVNPGGWRGGQLGTFSPDGSRLAAIYEPTSGDVDGAQLGVVDVATATVRLITWSGAATVNKVTWSPDGQRLFLATNSGHPLATFRIGDDRVRTLRARDLNVQDVAVLQPAR